LAVQWEIFEGQMKFSRPVIWLGIFIFYTFGLLAAQSQNEAQAPRQENSATQTAPLKAIDKPMAPFPEEVVRRGIEGKVTLSIVVDARGKVSQAKALGGPEELFPAALASVKMWQFEPPASAPVTTTVEIGYGVPKECPGPKSDAGGVEGNGRLVDKNGKLIAVVDNGEYPLPSYPEEERMAGIAGKMVLSVTLKRDGYVKEIHVAQSLSPVLDKAATDLVRGWKFKGCQDEPLCGDRNSNVPWKDLRLQFVFRAFCNPLLLQN
jgi:TonB family protein